MPIATRGGGAPYIGRIAPRSRAMLVRLRCVVAWPPEAIAQKHAASHGASRFPRSFLRSLTRSLCFMNTLPARVRTLRSVHAALTPHTHVFVRHSLIALVLALTSRDLPHEGAAFALTTFPSIKGTLSNRSRSLLSARAVPAFTPRTKEALCPSSPLHHNTA